MSLFAIGVFAFLWSFWNVVQRSRADEIAVTQVYLLLGPPTPDACRVAHARLRCWRRSASPSATALARPDGPDGNPGSSLAVGVLVPMFGFGLNGLWARTTARSRRLAMRPATESPMTPPRATRSARMMTMAETATEIITIDASPDAVWAIAADIANYPDWAHDIKDVTSPHRRRRTAGRGRVPRLGARPQHALHAALRLRRRPQRARLEDGERRHPALDRRALHASSPTDDGGTLVRYDLAIDLAIPLPGFVKRRAEVRILNTVRELKAYAEA